MYNNGIITFTFYAVSLAHFFIEIILHRIPRISYKNHNLKSKYRNPSLLDSIQTLYFLNKHLLKSQSHSLFENNSLISSEKNCFERSFSNKISLLKGSVIKFRISHQIYSNFRVNNIYKSIGERIFL